MKHENDVMLDLETMGTGPTAAIIAIGAVEFDLAAGVIGERFYATIDLASAVHAGGVMDAATVMWWMQQSDAAREAFASGDEHIASVLQRFAVWMEARGVDVRVWGNGAAFDNVILASAYRRNGTPPPWQFRNNRCYQTVKALRPGVPPVRVGTHHNAVDDAETQALHLMALMRPQSVVASGQGASNA